MLKSERLVDYTEWLLDPKEREEELRAVEEAERAAQDDLVNELLSIEPLNLK